ncbi:MAG: CoA-binding protein, partial [Rhodospirillaceae bacterium]|nr:CoA-binding protein [Rhodospirillaceae bacterium]
MTELDIEALLRPKSVAIIGASDDGTRTAGRPLRYLRRHGYKGRVYPINPRRETVQGEPAWPDLVSLPEVP